MNHYALLSRPNGTRTRCGETVLRCEANPALAITCPECRALLGEKVRREMEQATAREDGQERRFHEATARHFLGVLAA